MNKALLRAARGKRDARRGRVYQGNGEGRGKHRDLGAGGDEHDHGPLTPAWPTQYFGGQFQKTYKPRHYLCCGQAGPLGWEVPACLGVKLGKPESTVVGVVRDYSFQFLMEEVAVAVQYKVPYVLVMLNNAYMGLIRQGELNYDMNYAVDLGYEGPDGSYGIDNVRLMEAMGATGRRVHRPEDLEDAFEWAVKTSEERKVPVLVKVMCERETNAAMGLRIDRINEYEPILDGRRELAGQVVGGVPERD